MTSEEEINKHGRLSRNSSVVTLQVVLHLSVVLRTGKEYCMQFTGFPQLIGYMGNAGIL
jgi:hypothetical protein